MPAKEEERKLVRYLGVKYRCKFPIKGENHVVSPHIMAYLEHMISIEAQRIILGKNPK